MSAFFLFLCFRSYPEKLEVYIPTSYKIRYILEELYLAVMCIISRLTIYIDQLNTAHVTFNSCYFFKADESSPKQSRSQFNFLLSPNLLTTNKNICKILNKDSRLFTTHYLTYFKFYALKFGMQYCESETSEREKDNSNLIETNFKFQKTFSHYRSSILTAICIVERFIMQSG